MTAKAVNAITDKRGHRTVCEHLCSWWAGRWRDRDIGSRYIYNDPICMQMAAYRTDLSHSYSYVTEGSVHVSFLLLFCLPLFSPLPLYFSLFLYVWLFLIPRCDSWIPQVCPYTRVYRGERITSYRCAARGEQNASIARKRELTRFPGEPVPQFRRQRALSARVTLAPAAISPLILRRRSYWQTVASDRNWNWL